MTRLAGVSRVSRNSKPPVVAIKPEPLSPLGESAAASQANTENLSAVGGGTDSLQRTLSGNSSNNLTMDTHHQDGSLLKTPANRGRKKLFSPTSVFKTSQTPTPFTPPDEIPEKRDSPHTIVTRQLRSKKKMKL